MMSRERNEEGEVGGPSMVRMKAMVDEWEAEGELDHLPNDNMSGAR